LKWRIANKKHRSKYWKEYWKPYYKKNRNLVIGRVLKWQMKNRGRVLEYQRKNRIKRRKARGHHTFSEWIKKVRDHKWKCFYCGKRLTMKTLVQDHAIPLSRNGSDFIGNLLPSCARCNHDKYTKTVSEFLRERAA